MSSRNAFFSLLIAVVLVAACAAVDQQKKQPPAADDLHFHNLKVLPQNISHDELVQIMRGFTRGLGVRCGFCHEQQAGSEELDFASDAKPEKSSARTMMLMTRNINTSYLTKLPRDPGDTEHAGNIPEVTCWTCHRGKAQPEVPPPPPPQPARPS